LEEALDPRFVFHVRQPPEYGIDGDVEEFDEQERATGLHFFAQIKGTDEPDLAKALAVQIDLDKADYYRSAGLPVLMVRYHSPSTSLFARWFHQYDPYYSRGGKRTLTFRWEEGDAWTDAMRAKLAAEARAFLELRAASLRLPRPVYLSTEGALGLDVAEISLALRAAAAKRPDVMEFRGGDPPAGAVSVAVTDEELVASLGNVTKAVLHFDGPYDPGGNGERLANDAFLMVALAFEHLGQDDATTRLAMTYAPDSDLVTDEDVVGALSAAMGRAHRITEALRLADQLDDPADPDLDSAALTFTFPALYHRASLTGAELDEYRRVLERRVERRKEVGHAQQIGRAYMNLASFHRSNRRPDRAASYYEQALRHDPGYEHRAHYWYELGGALWGRRQYGRAADAYGRAIELGTSEPLAPALQADSLLYAGQYRAALEMLEEFNRQGVEQDGEYRLKELVARTIVKRLGIDSQDRRLTRALREAEGDQPQSAEEWAEQSIRQLREDALWGSAWLNLGTSDAARLDPTASLGSFVAATVLIPADYEAWFRAIVTAFLLPHEPVFTDLLVAGRRLGGDPLITHLVRGLSEHVPRVPRQRFVEKIEAVLAEHQEPPVRAFTVRMIGEHGVEEIVIRDDEDSGEEYSHP
jgi:tetratricopeptide (TPR) repeat protein